MQPREFLSLTPYEYSCVYVGHLKESSKRWEHTRRIVYSLYCVNTTENDRISEVDFHALLTDPVKEELSNEQILQGIKSAVERYKNVQWPT